MTNILYTNPTVTSERVTTLAKLNIAVAEVLAKAQQKSVDKIIWHALLQGTVSVFIIDRQYINDVLKAQIYKALATKVTVIIRNADGIQTVLDNTDDGISNKLYDEVSGLVQNINSKYGRIAEQVRMKATENGALKAIRRLISERLSEIRQTLVQLSAQDELFVDYARQLNPTTDMALLIPLCNRLADVYDVPRPTPDYEDYHPEVFDAAGYWTTKGGSTEPKHRHNSQYMTDTWTMPKDSRRYNDMYERDGCNLYTDWDMCYQLFYYLAVGLLPE